MTTVPIPEPADDPVVRRHPVAAIAAGGMVGSLARGGLNLALPVHPGAWPWPTFLVNVVGCLIIGVVVTRHDHYGAHHRWRPFLGTGLAGGLTTFSTLQVETLNNLNAGHVALAAGYVVVSILLGLGAIAASTWGVHRWYEERWS